VLRLLTSLNSLPIRQYVAYSVYCEVALSMLHCFSSCTLKRLLTGAVSASALCLCAVPAQARVAAPVERVVDAGGVVDYSFANTDGYQVSENVGNYPLVIDRDDASAPGVVCWGVTNESDEAGSNFTKVDKQQVAFAPGQSSVTVTVPINDQGINGPAKLARAYLYGCGDNGVSTTQDQTLTLLQNDVLQTRDPSNVLGYAPPTDGDPLQHVDWYVFGDQIAAGKAAASYQQSNPAWAQAFNVLADTPGSGSYRFWMWNQPTTSIAATTEKWFADAEQAQPNTTVQLTMYNLVHSDIAPSAIQSQYDAWISQFAQGLGNYRAVIYLEEDALITMPRVSPSERAVREAEVAYAVTALEQDPHVVVYIDAGASDTLITPRHYARMLKASDVAQAQGFSVNSTHHEWVASEIHFGQQISRYLGGAHFVVQTGSAGRGPDLNPHPRTQGVEDLCNPPGTGLGPLTWNTGYKDVDGLLWYANVGFTANIPCHDGAPGLATFWPQYAYGIVSRRVNQITGPKLPLVKSATDM
jgi:endoglucanase